MNKPKLGAGALALIGLLFIGIMLLANSLLRGAQLDLTHDKLYTLSDGTRNIVGDLKEPVNLYLFFSDRTATPIPEIKNYGTRVRELLEAMAARSNGKLTAQGDRSAAVLRRGGPRHRARHHGTPISAGGEKLYLGLAGTNSTDGKESIPFLDPKLDEQLEYDVAKLIHKLSTARKPVIGWLSSLPMSGDFDMQTGRPTPPWMVYSQVEQLYTVRSPRALADQDRRRHRRAGAGASRRTCRPPRCMPSTSTPCAAATSWRSSIRTRRRTTRARTLTTRWRSSRPTSPRTSNRCSRRGASSSSPTRWSAISSAAWWSRCAKAIRPRSTSPSSASTPRACPRT